MAQSERIARSVLALSAPRAAFVPLATGSCRGSAPLSCAGSLRVSTSIATTPSGPSNTARKLTRDNDSYRESTDNSRGGRWAFRGAIGAQAGRGLRARPWDGTRTVRM